MKEEGIDLTDGLVRIKGKGRKERIIQIENSEVLDDMRKYKEAENESEVQYFFL